MPLFLTAIARRVGIRFTREFNRLPVLRAWGIGKTTGALQNTFTFAGPLGAAGDSGHDSVLSKQVEPEALSREIRDGMAAPATHRRFASHRNKTAGRYFIFSPNSGGGGCNRYGSFRQSHRL